MVRRIQSCAAIAFTIAVAACTPTGETRQQTAERLAISKGFTPLTMEVAPYKLVGWAKHLGSSDTARIYIEGDGFAWRTPHQPSKDPTPTDPLTLRLAGEDPAAIPTIYLARPCHYYTARYCTAALWTDARFSQSVLESYNAALNQLRERFGITLFELVGYSGGGVVAALLAGTRSDVVNLRTIAAPLDTDSWVRIKGFRRALTGSLNPTSMHLRLANVPQTHFVGEQDNVVPPAVLRAYTARLGAARQCAKIELIQNASHRDGFINKWLTLLSETPVCAKNEAGVAK